MDDLISRQAAIDALDKHIDTFDAIDTNYLCGLRTAMSILKEMPSAQPVRHGKWIVEYEVKDGRSMRCSECQMVFWVGSGRDGNYCPNCGAKMDGEQEAQNGR